MAKHSPKKTGFPEVAQAKRMEVLEIRPNQATEGNGKLLLPRAALIAVMVFWIFLPVIHGDWLWDDEELISQNELMHDPGGLWKIWSEPGSLIDYYPLWYSAEWLQWHLWHDETLGYHLINIFLHLAGALLVWRLLDKFGLRLAWLGGLIFAIHPVQVESVAWMAELKNTLSLPPFLLAMCAYIDYDEQGKRGDYFLALGLFLIAMLCKTTMSLFPVVILLYTWWKRGRIRGADWKACAAFFTVSLVLGLITVWFQQDHAIRGQDIPIGGLFSRLALAGTSLSFYIFDCVWPVGLMPIYPKWTIDPPSLVQFLPWLMLGGVTYAFWTRRATWGRHVLLGLGFFLINLAPFLGFTTAFYMSFSWVADHILYLPLIGLIGLGIGGLEQASRQVPPSGRACGVGVVAALVALMAFESHRYAGMFVNQETLWTYTLEHNPEAWPAHNNLGNFLLRTGHNEEAMEHFRQALRINPQLAQAHNNWGNALLKVGRSSEAIEQYEAALKISPDYELAHKNMGIALAQTGRIPEAIEQDKAALEINPDDIEIHMDLGELLLETGQASEAAEQFDAALRNDPHYADFRKNLEKQKALEKSAPAKN
jgi:tetratricopeptide (TPR) repeat protein